MSFGGDGGEDDAFSDTTSMAGSARSSRSSRSRSSRSSRASKSSTPSQKVRLGLFLCERAMSSPDSPSTTHAQARRKLDGMKHSLRKGGVYEEEALVESLAAVVQRVNTSFTDIRELCHASFRALPDASPAKAAEDALAALQSSVEEHWASVFTPEPTHAAGFGLLHSASATSNSRVAATLRGLHLDDEEPLPPFNPLAPVLRYSGKTKAAWRLQCWRSGDEEEDRGFDNK